MNVPLSHARMVGHATTWSTNTVVRVLLVTLEITAKVRLYRCLNIDVNIELQKEFLKFSLKLKEFLSLMLSKMLLSADFGILMEP